MLVWPERHQHAVSPAVRRSGVESGLTVDLEDPIYEIHDPVLWKTRPRVKATLVLSIKYQARVRDLDQESRLRRMVVAIVANGTWNDTQVRLWL